MHRRILTLLLLLVALLLKTFSQSVIVGKSYLVLRVDSNDPKKVFKFEGAVIQRSNDKKSSFSIISGKTPFNLRISASLGCIFLRGVSGDGKLRFKYRTSIEEKETMQYIGPEEVVSINWQPHDVGAAQVSWTSKLDPALPEALRWPNAELLVRAHTNN